MDPSDLYMELADAAATVPPGAWAVGVSGGADSICLLHLLHRRDDLQLQAVHLNHELRGQESDNDEAFVRSVCRNLRVPCTVARLSELGISPHDNHHHNNPQARYRGARMFLFRRVVRFRDLRGVVLAHHQDDQAETIAQRLVRGSMPSNLRGISAESRFESLLVLHPLLRISKLKIRQWLSHQGLRWREDASNDSMDYQRNRIRKILADRPELTQALLELGQASAEWHNWLEANSPVLPRQFQCVIVQKLPHVMGFYAIRRWLRSQDIDVDRMSASAVGRVLKVACDAGFPPVGALPGRRQLRRRQGIMYIDDFAQDSEPDPSALAAPAAPKPPPMSFDDLLGLAEKKQAPESGSQPDAPPA